MYGICTAFITECTWDIPCLYSTCPCIAGHCGHCSSISLYLYEPSPTHILFVAPCQHVLWRVPLFPLFQDGNATSTIPYKCRQPNFHMEAQIPSRVDLRSRQEGEQCVQGELVALAVWEGQASPWGAFGGRHRGPSNSAPDRQS